MSSQKKSKVTPSMWVRRIISTGILLVLVALLGTWLWNFGSGILDRGRDALNEQHQKSTAATEHGPIQIEDCSPKDVELRVKPEADTIKKGNGTRVSVEVKNQGKAQCIIPEGEIQIALSVGGDDVWQPSECDSPWHPTLLLGTEKSWESTLEWDGNVYVDCKTATSGKGKKKAPIQADVGMYDLEATLGDSDKTERRQIEITKK